MHERRFECRTCGNITSAPKSRNQTAAGHVKSMYCYICRMITNHVQISEFDRRLEGQPTMNEVAEIRMNQTTQTPIEVLLQVGEDGTVSSKKVYDFLGMRRADYARWCKRNILDNEFAEENVDFTPFRQSAEHGGQSTIDYKLTVAFAKKLCMLSKNERGEQARDYFIKAEKTLQAVALSSKFEIPQTLPDALRLAADYAEHNQQLRQTIEQQKPQVQLAEAVTASENSISVNELAKIIKQNGVDTGRNRMMSWFRDNGYLCKVKGDEYNLPTYRSAKMGLFEVEEYSYDRNGITYTNFTPKVTRKGQAYFIQKFCYQN